MLVAKADALRDAKDYSAAASLYTQALLLHPGDAGIQVQAGHMFKEAGQFDRAEAHYLEAERRMPGDPDLHLQRGHFYKRAGRIPEAIAAYQVAVTLSADPAPREELAALEAVPTETPKDTLLAARAVVLQPKAQRVGGLFQFGPPKKAIRALRRKADAARDDAKDFAVAAGFYAEALQLDPADAALQVQAGHMFKEIGRLDTAERHYLTARAMIPADADLHLQFGHFYKVAGRLPEAALSYRNALLLKPGLAEAVEELARLSPPPVEAASPPQPQQPVWRQHGPVPPRPGVLFDEAFYRSRASVPEGQDPWAHYCTMGVAAGLDPHWLFSTGVYLAASPDVVSSGENPLVHFLRVGRSQGRPMHWLFSATHYSDLNPEVAPQDALDHLLGHGLADNRQPHPLFLPAGYLARYPHVAAAGMPAFEHYLKYGDREGLTPHPLFDPAFYLEHHALPQGTPPFEHYMRHGAPGMPNELFDGQFYLRNAPDVAQAGINPLLHYVTQGAAEGRAQHPLFDPAYYLEQVQTPAARSNPLLHYLTQGAAHRLSPNRLFDPAWYQDHSARSWDGRTLPLVGPCISVLVPVYNTPPDALRACIESVRHQYYASWELCLVDDCSTDAATVAVLESYRGTDERIKVMRSPSNLHIAGATNFVARQATGEFLAFLDHDDTLAVHALAEVALAVTTNSRIDLLYTDEDKLDFNGQHVEPYRKPDWSKDHLYSVMYVLHLLVVRKALFWQLGGLRPERSGAQDYDLALRATQVARHVHHIPRILYHWRMVPGSAAAVVDAKPYALIAAQKALEDALAKAGADAVVEDGLLQGTFRVRYSLATEPAVTLLVISGEGSRDVPGRGRINLVRNFVRSIAERTTYRNYRLVVVDDNANSSPETRRLVKEVGGEIISYPAGPRFNYAGKLNWATRATQTDHLVYLNDDMEVISPGWIEALLELSTQEEIGGVGARLLYPDGAVQHAGMVLGINDACGHVFLTLPRDHVGYNGYTHLIRNYSAVTGAVFATRKDVMEAVGGLDERLRVDFNDVDLCLRIGRTGKRIVYTPYCELYHFEGSTAVRTTQAPEEAALFKERWAEKIAYDPFYNPECPRDRLHFV